MVLINELIGSFGKYHLCICFLIFISRFGVAFHLIAIIFLAPPAEYKCPDGNSCCENPVYNKTIFTRTIVTEWNLICQYAWLSDFNQMMFQLGVLSGSLLFGIASDKYGRKPSLIGSVILEVFSGIITSFLPDYWSFTIIRMILGFSVGGVTVIGFVLIMEFVGHKYRNLVSALFHVPFTLGHIVLALLGFLIRDYVYFQLFISLFNSVLLIYICVLPESPRWLLAVNKTVKAINLMEKIARINGLPTEEIQGKIDLYQMENIHARHKGTVFDLFRTPNMRQHILVMSFIWLVCSYCFFGMAHYISHMTGDVYINVLACGSVCFCACFISIPVMMFLKRKTSVMISSMFTSFSFFVIIFVSQEKLAIVFACCGVLFNYVLFITIYLYCSEMFPTVMRNAALGICSMMARGGAMIAPFVVSLRAYGKWCAPLAFGIFPLITTFLVLFLPETKDCELMATIDEAEGLALTSRRSEDIDQPSTSVEVQK